MGLSCYICNYCKEPIVEYWIGYWCEECGEPICSACLERIVDIEQHIEEVEDEDGYKWEYAHSCPVCSDPFQHMTKDFEY